MKTDLKWKAVLFHPHGCPGPFLGYEADDPDEVQAWIDQWRTEPMGLAAVLWHPLWDLPEGVVPFEGGDSGQVVEYHVVQSTSDGKVSVVTTEESFAQGYLQVKDKDGEPCYVATKHSMICAPQRELVG